MHFHHLLGKVSLFAHRQQDSKACHVCYCALFTALTMAQRVRLPVSTGTFPRNWVRKRQNFPLESGKYAPMTIKARLRPGLIELHGFSNWRQRTFYLEMLGLGCFRQHYHHCFRRKAAAVMGALPDTKKKKQFPLPLETPLFRRSSLWEDCGAILTSVPRCTTQ